MTWIQTKTARFIEEEVIAVQFLPSNYSRANTELIIFLRGGGEIRFSGEEANQRWEKYNENTANADSSE
jgi:hypothetical protein